jgi:adenylylsulfate kinase
MANFRVLVLGLPGAGKTTLAADIAAGLFLKTKCLWLNADTIREQYNDWDFSENGRIRQSVRMRHLADEANVDVVMVDMVAPMQEQRDIFDANFVVWVDTIKEGRYEDTNRMFLPPDVYNCRVVTMDSKHWGKIISDQILLKLSNNGNNKAQHT